MTESMIIEAIRAAGGMQDPATAGAIGAAPQVADPAAVSRFEAAMGVHGVAGPQAVTPPDAIPFASEASALWRSAQVNNQGLLHRIRALTQLGSYHSPSAAQMLELQYEVANLSFQQEVVTKVADKSSTAIQTLIKNQ